MRILPITPLIFIIALFGINCYSQSFLDSIYIEPGIEYEEFYFKTFDTDTINIRYNVVVIDTENGDTTYASNYVDTLQFVLGVFDDSIQYFKYKQGNNSLLLYTSMMECQSIFDNNKTCEYMSCSISKKDLEVTVIDCADFKNYWTEVISNISDCDFKHEYQTIEKVKSRANSLIENCLFSRPTMSIEYLFDKFIIPVSEDVSFVMSEQIDDLKLEFNVMSKFVESIYGGTRVGFFFNVPAGRIDDIMNNITKENKEELPSFLEAQFIEYDAGGSFIDREIVKNTSYSSEPGVKKTKYVLYKFTRV